MPKTKPKLYKCYKCKKSSKKDEGYMKLGGAFFCCKKCCDGKKKTDKNVCEFC